VEYKEVGTLIGDLEAGSLTAAAVPGMRGNVQCVWPEGAMDDTASPKGAGIPPRRGRTE